MSAVSTSPPYSVPILYPQVAVNAENPIDRVAKKNIRILGLFFLGLSTGLLMAYGVLSMAVVLSISLLVYSLIVTSAKSNFFPGNPDQNAAAKAAVYVQCIFWGAFLIAGVLCGITLTLGFWGSYLAAHGSLYGFPLTLLSTQIFASACHRQLSAAEKIAKQAPIFAANLAKLHTNLAAEVEPHPEMVKSLLEIYQEISTEGTEEACLEHIASFYDKHPELLETYILHLLPAIKPEFALRLIHRGQVELLNPPFIEKACQANPHLPFLAVYTEPDMVLMPEQFKPTWTLLKMGKLIPVQLDSPLYEPIIAELQTPPLKEDFPEFAPYLCRLISTVEEIDWLMRTFPELNQREFINANFPEKRKNAYFGVNQLEALSATISSEESGEENLLKGYHALSLIAGRLKTLQLDSTLQSHQGLILGLLNRSQEKLMTFISFSLEDGAPVTEVWKSPLGLACLIHLRESFAERPENSQQLQLLKSFESKLPPKR